MISLVVNTAGTKNERIEKWVVMFQTPFGLAESQEEAVKKCLENDFNADLCIVPVPVAITKNSYEVVIKG